MYVSRHNVHSLFVSIDRSLHLALRFIGSTLRKPLHFKIVEILKNMQPGKSGRCETTSRL